MDRVDAANCTDLLNCVGDSIALVQWIALMTRIAPIRCDAPVQWNRAGVVKCAGVSVVKICERLNVTPGVVEA